MYESVGCTKVVYLEGKDRLLRDQTAFEKSLYEQNVWITYFIIQIKCQKKENLATSHYITHLGNLYIVLQ